VAVIERMGARRMGPLEVGLAARLGQATPLGAVQGAVRIGTLDVEVTPATSATPFLCTDGRSHPTVGGTLPVRVARQMRFPIPRQLSQARPVTSTTSSTRSPRDVWHGEARWLS